MSKSLFKSRFLCITVVLHQVNIHKGNMKSIGTGFEKSG